MEEGAVCPDCGSRNVVLVQVEGSAEEGDITWYRECRECGLHFGSDVNRLMPKEFFSDDAYSHIQQIAQLASGDGLPDGAPLDYDDPFLGERAGSLAMTLLAGEVRSFARELEWDDEIARRLLAVPAVARMVTLGLEYGVACEDGACAAYLGSLHYRGIGVAQDYARAKQLFELAERKGVTQAMLNLGYIYEYGRTEEPDFQKAFNQYAKVAALTGDSEALYKMGDMYDRAQAVERDVRVAYWLYEESLGAAGDNVIAQAQPAVRIASLISDRDNVRYDVPYDPMRALELYQTAERGLRIDIAHGRTYYQQRLDEALEGQVRVRELLADPLLQL